MKTSIPTPADHEFFLDRIKKAVEKQDWQAAVKAIKQIQLLEDAAVIYREHRCIGEDCPHCYPDEDLDPNSTGC
jgi:hypothetical protein